MTDYRKKILTLVLTALLLLPNVSCSEKTENADNDTSKAAVNEPGTSEENVSEETEEDLINVLAKSFTPELKTELGLDGYESNVLLRVESAIWCNPDIMAEETTGDRLNDAVYNRNAWLESTYGFSINAEYSSGDGNELKTLVQSGDDVYDFAFPQARAAASMAQTGVMLDLTKVPYLDIENPSWSQMFTDMLMINGKLFYAAGDISVNSYEAVRALLFNKQLASNYNLSDPYSLVREGEWTLDNFNVMSTASSQDLDGNGTRTAADQWGMAWQSAKGGIVFYYGGGEHLTILNDQQLPEVSVGSERSINVFNKVRDMIADANTYYQGADDEILTIFQEGRSLFMTEVLYHVNSMRQSDVEFGILPMPKFDTAQEEYIQAADGYCVSPVVIPSIVQNVDRAGFIVEALAEASCTMIKPEYYEIVLKGKLTRDEESSEMLDIIYENFVIDNCDIYQWGGIESSISSAMTSGQDLASVAARNAKVLTKVMERTVQALDEVGN